MSLNARCLPRDWGENDYTLVILTADGAPGNPGWQVLNSLMGLKSPRPQLFSPATLNLYVIPESNSCFSQPVKLWGPGIFHCHAEKKRWCKTHWCKTAGVHFTNVWSLQTNLSVRWCVLSRQHWCHVAVLRRQEVVCNLAEQCLKHTHIKPVLCGLRLWGNTGNPLVSILLAALNVLKTTFNILPVWMVPEKCFVLRIRI